MVDVLLNTCGQLLVNLAEQLSISVTQDLHAKCKILLAYFDELTFEQLNVPSTEPNTAHRNKFSLRLGSPRSRAEGLCYFSVVCLDLFIRFNDGSSNSVLVSNAKSNSWFVLNEFCDVLFNKVAKGKSFYSYENSRLGWFWGKTGKLCWVSFQSISIHFENGVL